MGAMTKARLQYVCQACGYASPKWLGRCPACEAWNSLVEEVAGDVGTQPPAPPAVPVAMTEVVSTSQPRMATGSAELDRVLGGGLVPGSLVLIGGDPGIGKTTLLTQACRNLAEAGHLVLYVSGEESAAQVKLRADRLGVATPNLLLLAEANLEAILGACKQEHPQVVVVDSIQTVVKPGLSSASGRYGSVPPTSCGWRRTTRSACSSWGT